MKSESISQIHPDSFLVTEIGKIPSDWELTTAEEYCGRVTDGTHSTPKKVTEGKYLVTSKHLNESEIDFEQAYLISKEDFDEINRRSAVEQWDVIIGMIGEYLGGVYIEKNEKINYAIKNVGLFKCAGKEIKGKWLYYYLSSKQAQEYINTIRSGTSQPYITLDSLRKFPVIFPRDKEEMERIVSIADSIQCEINLLSNMNKTLEAFGQAVFKRWFVDFEFPNQEGKPYKSTGRKMDSTQFGEIPEDWEIKRLGDITDVIFSGGTPNTQNEAYWNGDFPWLSSGETGNHFITRTNETITQSGIDNSSTRLAKAGDVVIASAGQGKTRGQTSLCFLDTYINQSVIAIRAKNYITTSSFLYFDLARRYNQFRAMSDSNSIRGSLTTRAFKDLEIIKPPFKLVSDFDSLMTPLLKKININLLQNETLTRTRDFLLPKLMSGKIRVPLNKENGEVT